MGRENLSGKGAFPGWCPHCWGSSHSFQPDVLGQGAGHSLRPCRGCFSPTRVRAPGTGLFWQGWHGAGGAEVEPAGTGGWQPLKVLWPRVPKHLPHPGEGCSGCGHHSGADPTPPRCPTVAEHLPMLGTTRAPNPPEPVLYLIMTWQGWVPGCFYNPPWAPTARVWLPWKCRQLTKSSHKARPRCTPCALAQTQFPRLGMPLECQGSPLAMLLGTRAPGASPARARKRRRCPQFLPRVRRHRSSPGSAARS